MVTGKGQKLHQTGQQAVQVWPMDIPRDIYHTEWVADRTIMAGQQSTDTPWFCWMSFPTPPPWDVPSSELHRVNWRDIPPPRLFLRTNNRP